MRFVPPMAALLVDVLPTGKEWLYEAKFDSYRAVAMKDGARACGCCRGEETISRLHTRRFETLLRALPRRAR